MKKYIKNRFNVLNEFELNRFIMENDWSGSKDKKLKDQLVKINKYQKTKNRNSVY